jgi:hypothetical protein
LNPFFIKSYKNKAIHKQPVTIAEDSNKYFGKKIMKEPMIKKTTIPKWAHFFGGIVALKLNLFDFKFK